MEQEQKHVFLQKSYKSTGHYDLQTNSSWVCKFHFLARPLGNLVFHIMIQFLMVHGIVANAPPLCSMFWMVSIKNTVYYVSQETTRNKC